MPSTIKIRVYGARDLPVMDQSTGLADPFVTIKFGETKKQETRIAKKTLNPVWQETFRIEVPDDNLLQDEPVIFRVFDKDLYTADDSIGVVVIDLNCLLMNPTTTGGAGGGGGGGSGGPNTTGSGASAAGGGASAGASGGAGPTGGENVTDTTSALANKISGWFPIYDTLHGVRGQLRLSVKLQFFGDVNPFKDSAAGIQFFQVSSLEGHCIHEILGFVEELMIENDPEYHWVDSFRSSRTSNETRQKLFYCLTSRIRRNVGRKCIDLGGNAVLGYRQTFDLEGESGITARAYGTAVRIHKLGDASCDTPTRGNPLDYLTIPITSLGAAAVPAASAGSGAASMGLFGLAVGGGSTAAGINLNSELKNASTAGSGAAGGSPALDEKGMPIDGATALPKLDIPDALKPNAELRRTAQWKRDVHLLTLTEFPPTVQLTLGGIVSTSAIKLLDNSFDKAGQELRDAWWREIRTEIKTHARALRCPLVIGYHEVTTIYDDIMVLSAYGTAARVGWYRTSHVHAMNFSPTLAHQQLMVLPKGSARSSPRFMGVAASINTPPFRRAVSSPHHVGGSGAGAGGGAAPVDGDGGEGVRTGASALKRHRRPFTACAVFHIPYTRQTAPFRMTLVPCAMCGRKWVPEMVLSTIQPHAQGGATASSWFDRTIVDGGSSDRNSVFGVPLGTDAEDGLGYGFPILGSGQLLEARVCRSKKRLEGEANATQISQAVPFLEYSLHQQLMYKLRVMGMNCAFGLRWQLSIGETMLIGIATATAIYSPALPPPPLLSISRSIAVQDEEDQQLVAIQERLMELSHGNRNYWNRLMTQWMNTRALWRQQREWEADQARAEREQERNLIARQQQLAQLNQSRASSGNANTALVPASTGPVMVAWSGSGSNSNSSHHISAAASAQLSPPVLNANQSMLLPPSIAVANPSLAAALSLNQTAGASTATVSNSVSTASSMSLLGSLPTSPNAHNNSNASNSTATNNGDSNSSMSVTGLLRAPSVFSVFPDLHRPVHPPATTTTTPPNGGTPTAALALPNSSPSGSGALLAPPPSPLVPLAVSATASSSPNSPHAVTSGGRPSPLLMPPLMGLPPLQHQSAANPTGAAPAPAGALTPPAGSSLQPPALALTVTGPNSMPGSPAVRKLTPRSSAEDVATSGSRPADATGNTPLLNMLASATTAQTTPPAGHSPVGGSAPPHSATNIPVPLLPRALSDPSTIPTTLVSFDTTTVPPIHHHHHHHHHHHGGGAHHAHHPGQGPHSGTSHSNTLLSAQQQQYQALRAAAAAVAHSNLTAATALASAGSHHSSPRRKPALKELDVHATGSKLALPPRVLRSTRKLRVAGSADDSSGSDTASDSDDDLEQPSDGTNGGANGNQPSFVLQVDDEVDEDTMAVLLEPQTPSQVMFCNTESLPRDEWKPYYEWFGQQIQERIAKQQQLLESGGAGDEATGDAADSGSAAGAGTGDPNESAGSGGAALDSSSNPSGSTVMSSTSGSNFSSTIVAPAPGASSAAAVNGSSGVPPSTTAESSIDDPIQPFQSIFSTPATFYMSPILPHLSTGVQNVQMVSLLRRVEWSDDATGVTERVVKRPDKKQLALKAAKGGDSKQQQAALAAAARKVILPPTQIRLRPKGLNQRLAAVFHDLYATLAFKVRSFGPVHVCGIKTDVKLPDEDQIEVLLTAMVVRPVVHMTPSQACVLHDRLVNSAAMEAQAAECESDEEQDDDGTSSEDDNKAPSGLSSKRASVAAALQRRGSGGTAGRANVLGVAPLRRASSNTKRLRERKSNESAGKSGTPTTAAVAAIVSTKPPSSRSPATATRIVSTIMPPASVAPPPASLTATAPVLPGLQPLASINLSIRSSSSTNKAGAVAALLPSDPRVSIKVEGPSTAGSTKPPQVQHLLPPHAGRPSATTTLPGIQLVTSPSSHHKLQQQLSTHAPPPSALLAVTQQRRGSVSVGGDGAGTADNSSSSSDEEDEKKEATTRKKGFNPNRKDSTEYKSFKSVASPNVLSPLPTPRLEVAAAAAAAATAKPVVVGLNSAAPLFLPNMLSSASSNNLLAVAAAANASGGGGAADASGVLSPTGIGAGGANSSGASVAGLSRAASSAALAAAAAGAGSGLLASSTFTSTTSSNIPGNTPGSAPGINFVNHKNHHHFIESTPLSHLPNAIIERYLGRVHVHFIKEIWSYREEGGLGVFTHRFLNEANLALRAHVVSRGGNAMISYTVNELQVIEANKNQAYSVISLSCDAVRASYRHSGTRRRQLGEVIAHIAANSAATIAAATAAAAAAVGVGGGFSSQTPMNASSSVPYSMSEMTAPATIKK